MSNSEDILRQTGRTLRQLVAAPQNSTYVWPSPTSINYPRSLAEYLGRSDLEFIPLHQFVDHSLSHRPYVLDHHCYPLTQDVRRKLAQAPTIRQVVSSLVKDMDLIKAIFAAAWRLGFTCGEAYAAAWESGTSSDEPETWKESWEKDVQWMLETETTKHIDPMNPEDWEKV